MLITEKHFDEMLNAISREIRGRVELYEGSALLDTFTYDGALQSYVIERIGESNKFFGFGVCQKCTVKLRDKERAINIKKGQGIEVVFGVAENYLYTCPIFFVEDVKRDENTNEITVIAYDALYGASKHTVSEVTARAPYTIRTFTHECAAIIGVPLAELNNEIFDVSYPTGANFDGAETIREVLDDIAEATGTIYYINNNWELVFKQLDINGAPVLHVDKSKYFTLASSGSHILASLVDATELGDNVRADSELEGEIQYLRNNAFLNLREDRIAFLNKILNRVSGLTITNYDCKWRANFLLEIGDKISFTAKDGSIITSYVFDDTITYNGGLVGHTSLQYAKTQGETDRTPNTLSDIIKQTYARVDKVNKTVEIVTSEVDGFDERIAEIEMDTESISASVSKTQETLNAATSGLNKEIETLNTKVEATMTAEDITIAIQAELSNGIDSVTTSTGFTFNEEGLTVTKAHSEMSTTITEDGMTVSKDGSEVLTANNKGVQAIDLHATTYLIIGNYSRLEDYGGRTACFWIG